MATLQAKRLRQALQKATKVGVVEEAVNIGGCSLVLSSLTPEDYERINAELEDLPEGPEYLHGFQIGHLSRSIVEIEGEDLRDISFIEDEVQAGSWKVEGDIPDPEMPISLGKDKPEVTLSEIKKALEKAGGHLNLLPPEESVGQPVKVERYDWIRKNLLASWAREAISVGWRKFADVAVKSEQQAKEGVTFLIADESAEEKYRRLFGELLEAGGEVADDMIDHILEDSSLQRRTTAAEVKEAGKALADVPQQAEPEQPPPPQPVPEEPARPDPQELMRNRTPLNQGNVGVPVPAQQQVSQARPARVPAQIAQAVGQPPVGNPEGSVKARASVIAQMEGVDPGELAEAQRQLPARLPPDVAFLNKGVEKADPRGIVAITDKPPVGGINPRYKRPPTL